MSEVPEPSSTRVAAPARRHDLGGVGAQDLALGPGRVVLGQAGDLVEEQAPPFVVEPHGRQPLLGPRESGEDVSLEGFTTIAGTEVHVDGELRNGDGLPARCHWRDELR